MSLYWRVRRFILALVHRARKHRLSASAAAVAFYVFLAFVPTLAALVMIYGLVFDPGDVAAQLEVLGRVAPSEVVTLVSGEAERLVHAQKSALGLGVAGGLLLAVWSASKGARALIDSLDIVRDEIDRRGFLELYALSLVFTAAVLMGLAIAIGLLVTLPLLAPYLPPPLAVALVLLRWVVLFGLVVVAIGGLYRVSRQGRTRGRFFSPGALAAALMWLAASYLFQLYVDKISKLGASFGSVSTVAVFMLWLYLSVHVVLLGAEIDGVHDPAPDRCQ